MNHKIFRDVAIKYDDLSVSEYFRMADDARKVYLKLNDDLLCDFMSDFVHPRAFVHGEDLIRIAPVRIEWDDIYYAPVNDHALVRHELHPYARLAQHAERLAEFQVGTYFLLPGSVKHRICLKVHGGYVDLSAGTHSLYDVTGPVKKLRPHEIINTYCDPGFSVIRWE